MEESGTRDNNHKDEIFSKNDCVGGIESSKKSRVEKNRHTQGSVANDELDELINFFDLKDEIEEDDKLKNPNQHEPKVNDCAPPLDSSYDLTNEFTTDKLFDSRDELIEWCRVVGMENNTIVVISRSVKKAGVKFVDNIETTIDYGKGSFVYLCCERSSVYRKNKQNDDKPKTDNKQKRTTGTKKCSCPFQLRGCCLETLKWRLKVNSGLHNHARADSLTGHPYAARFTDEQLDLLKTMTDSGCKPTQFLCHLRDRYKNNYSNLRTVYNANYKIRKKEREGRTNVQQLMKLLTENEYAVWTECEEGSNKLKHIFWVNPSSRSLAQSFPYFAIVDCTYKTNKWKLPLFHAAGMTSTGRDLAHL